METEPRKARTCRCPSPERQYVEGIPYCGICEELLPDPKSELLPLIARELLTQRKVLERLASYIEPPVRRPDPDALSVDANEAGRMLGLTPATLRERYSEYGGFKIGKGPKARIRFPRAHLERLANGGRRVSAPSPPPKARAKARKSRRKDLLPIRGQR